MRGSLSVRRRREPVFWNVLNRFLSIVLVAGILAGIALWFYPEVTRRNELAHRLESEKKELAAQELVHKQREREVYLLENDKGYIETIARDKLDLMKTNETIIRLESAPAPAPKADTK